MVPEHEADWIADCFADFHLRFGKDWLTGRPTVLPTRDYIDAPRGTGHATAQAVFEQVKSHMGLGPDWEVRLAPQESSRQIGAVADSVLVQHDETPILATFRVDQDGPLITYDPSLLDTPQLFVATMSHELAHLMEAVVPRAEPFEQPMLGEMATDILSVASGFGIFKLETAFTNAAFGDSFAQGWSTSRQGYISPEFAAFALGLNLRLCAADEASVYPHLSKKHQKLLRQALAQIDADATFLETVLDPE